MSKIISILLFLVVLVSCSFKPMLANKKYDFRFVNIKFEGDKKVNEIVKQNLIQSGSGKENFDIFFETKKIKEIISSNAKGDPEKFKLEIQFEYQIIKNEEILINKSIRRHTSYNNINDKFELSQFEANVINNITEEIIQEILTSVMAVGS